MSGLSRSLQKLSSSARSQVCLRAPVRALRFSSLSTRPASAWKNTHATSTLWGGAVALTGFGLGLETDNANPSRDLDTLPPPPQSSVRLYELSFGVVCGTCAGVFIKKGAKTLAFVLGGVFVMLQYFASLRLVRINWAQAEAGFKELFYTKSMDADGQQIRRPPTMGALWRWLVGFLAADFQPRASFLAGMALGLRIG